MALLGEIIMQKLYAVKLCAGGIFGSDTEYLFLESEPDEIEFRAGVRYQIYPQEK